MVHYDFIEIGTSDFDTQIQICPDHYRGLSIDPLVQFLNRLPDKPNVQKIACAISDKEETKLLYYIPIQTIEAMNLPQWVRGCNAIGHIHKDFIANNIQHLVVADTIHMYPIHRILKEHNVSSIGFLKIDTEGYDYTILRSFLEICTKIPSLYANYIEFENMSDSNEAHVFIEYITSHGYVVMVSTVPGNTLVRKKRV